MSDIPVSEQRVREILARAQYDFARQQKHVDAGFNGGDNLPALNRFRDMIALCEEVLRLRTAQPKGESGVTQEVRDIAIRALHRDINFAYSMANYWFQKHGPFSSVDKGNAAQDYAKKCEAAIAALRAPSLSAVATSSGEGDELYRLLVVRGYAQHEAYDIAFGPNKAPTCGGSQRIQRVVGTGGTDWDIQVEDCPGCSDCASPPAKASGAFEGVTEALLRDVLQYAGHTRICVDGMHAGQPCSCGWLALASRLTRGYAAERQWVKYKKGDPLPPRGCYLVCTKYNTGRPRAPDARMETVRHTDDVAAWNDYTVAYWPDPLPAPYVSAESEGAGS